MDWEGPPADDDDDDEHRVIFPDTASTTLVDPLHPCNDFGISMYCATRDFVRGVLSERSSA